MDDETESGRGEPGPTRALPRSALFSGRTTLRIDNPHAVHQTLLAAIPAADRERLGPAVIRARRFEPADPARRRADPAEAAIEVALAHAAGMRISASVMRRGMAMTVAEPGPGTLTFGIRLHGAITIAGCGRDRDGAWGVGMGVLYREREGARIVTSDDHSGIAFEIPYARIAAVLESLTERPVAGEVLFPSAFSLSDGIGAAIGRLAAFIEAEAAFPSSLLSEPHTAAGMEDLLIRALLRLPHSHARTLARNAAAAAPYNVSRAEDFMRAQAAEAPTIDDIAQAAGCSVRALQVAFRRFRGHTPMDALRRIRLERADRDLRAGGASASVIDVAARYGFSNPGRFAADYRRAFGHPPSQTRRQAAERG